MQVRPISSSRPGSCDHRPQIEFGLRIETPDATGVAIGQDAGTADHPAAIDLAHQEVLADLVELVGIEALIAPREIGAQLLAEDAEAQGLGLADFVCGGRQFDEQAFSPLDG